MRRLSLVAALAVALALLGSSLLSAQRAGGRGGRRGMAPERAQAPTEAERISQMLEPLGLSATERAAAEKAVTAKVNAHRDLRQQYDKLQEVAANKNATKQQLSTAFDEYTKAVERYHSVVRSEDRALVPKLSPQARVACLAAGVLDNAMGMGARRGGGGRSGGGGMRGGGMRGGGGGGAGGGGGPRRGARRGG